MHDRLPLYRGLRYDRMRSYHLLRRLDALQTRFLRKSRSAHGSEDSSPDPENIPGEIVCRGPNVMLGYYKNEEATAEVVDKDGWLHTGDLALMDAEGNVTIKGRSKNMLLGPNGQNIYPEEIEDKLNNLPYVAESIIVQQNEKLVGLVYPDFDDAFAHGLNNDDIERVMEENRVALNAELPAYSQISKMKIYPEEFEKTPKKSIKRFLYQEAKDDKIVISG